MVAGGCRRRTPSRSHVRYQHFISPVQDRLAALHHLDCPWRPADLAQRDGRGVRQDNLNPEIEVLAMSPEDSFEAYLWQTVSRKAGFIAQMVRGQLDIREIEDVGDAALSYDEVKALPTGDPRVMGGGEDRRRGHPVGAP